MKQENGLISWSLETDQKIWSNDHGSVQINAGINSPADGKTDTHIGVKAAFEWRR